MRKGITITGLIAGIGRVLPDRKKRCLSPLKGGKMIKIGKKTLSGVCFLNGTCPGLLKKGVDPFLLLTFIIGVVVVGVIFGPAALASDVDIYNVSLQNANTTNDTVDVKFDLAQDNVMTAGTDANSADFYDRVWIFVKYSTDSGATWNHATLTTGGSITTYASGIGISADGMGAFCSPGTNQTVRWGYGTDSVADTATAQVRVFAIEMVLIPTGNFYFGDNVGGTGGSVDTALDKDDDNPALISTTGNVIYSTDTGSDDAQFGQSGPGILVDGDGGIDEDGTTTISNANYPTGYSAFYIMKYEISQKQYADFLNTLTQVQQNTRVVADLSNEDDANTYVLIAEDQATVANRQVIKAGSNPADGSPYTFGCDADDDDTLNEANDGQWRACNYLSWSDFCAYTDWAGLRPMTGLEYEKASRGGGSSSVAQEKAWGTANFTDADTVANDGTVTEGVTETGEGLVNYANDGVVGPLRCGFAATAATTRLQAGASYYGVMDLSGNVAERAVTIGIAAGRSFAGTHGDGELTTTTSYEGNATNTDWPGINATPARGVTGYSGAGKRGGGWDEGESYLEISNRTVATSGDSSRGIIHGGRCVRTSP